MACLPCLVCSPMLPVWPSDSQPCPMQPTHACALQPPHILCAFPACSTVYPPFFLLASNYSMEEEGTEEGKFGGTLITTFPACCVCLLNLAPTFCQPLHLLCFWAGWLVCSGPTCLTVFPDPSICTAQPYCFVLTLAISL